MQDRLTDVEIKIAHLENSVDELSDVLTAQQESIRLLEAMLEQLRQVIQEQGEAETGNPQDERPPHY